MTDRFRVMFPRLPSRQLFSRRLYNLIVRAHDLSAEKDVSLLVALSEIAGRNSVKLSRRVKTDRKRCFMDRV